MAIEKKQYTKEELLQCLIDFQKKHGRNPQQTDFKSTLYPSPSTYRRAFGTWNKALLAAGLEPNRNVVDRSWKSWSDDYLLKRFKEEYERINPKDSKEFWRKRIDFPSSTALLERGFTWEELKEKIGAPKTFKSKNDWIESIQYEIKKADRVLSYKEMLERLGGLRAFLIREKISYTKLIESLGYTPLYTKQVVNETNEELIEQYVSFSKKLGYPATSADLNESDDIHSSFVFAMRFGGINKLRRIAQLPETQRRNYRYTKEYFVELLTGIYCDYGRVTDETLDELLHQEGTSLNTLLRYFQTTKTSAIWKEIEELIMEGLIY